MDATITTLLIFGSIFAIAGITTWIIFPERRADWPGTVPKEKKMWKKIKRAVQNWWRCRMKACDYYHHYLAYGPAELTHEGYHAACTKCDECQKRDSDWLTQHPEAVDSPFRKQCETWEKRIRA